MAQNAYFCELIDTQHRITLFITIKNNTMNRFFRIALLVLMSAIGMSVMAQESAQIPVDPKVRIGKLSNGLTYYIRHNDYPKGQAEFYIAQ